MRLLFYALQDQGRKAFDFRKFFDYDDQTCQSFLSKMLLIDQDELNKVKPKDFIMNLTSAININ